MHFTECSNLSSYSKKYNRLSLYTTTYMNTVSVQTAQHAHFYIATATLVGSAIAGSSGLPNSIRQEFLITTEKLYAQKYNALLSSSTHITDSKESHIPNKL